MVFVVDSDSNVAAFGGFGGGDHAPGRFETPEGGYLNIFGSFDHLFAGYETIIFK